MLNSRARAAFLSPWPTRAHSSSTLSGIKAFLRPVYAPRCLARAIPSRWRSLIKSRSNCATAPRTESIRFAIGGLVGLVVANICVQGTKSLIPADLYRLQELHVDTNALVFIF